MTKTYLHFIPSLPHFYLGTLEFQDSKGEFHDFEIIRQGDTLFFGGACNAGFLQSGFMDFDAECETQDDALAELLADLETYYNDGPSFTSRIVCSERM